ncbi:hypothetical protein CHS0354_021395 [Potamilus streckersoni]|uniref:Uncharacterized protein n=1 Tax=Potamilus streckersoni TaxID=2493646 RepID=A0AAE0S1J8_9BIVA|nr:hypothetical protein CHS0354_021395 [Potamilus streckersoni]
MISDARGMEKESKRTPNVHQLQRQTRDRESPNTKAIVIIANFTNTRKADDTGSLYTNAMVMIKQLRTNQVT